jgi:hypothetical protein
MHESVIQYNESRPMSCRRKVEILKEKACSDACCSLLVQARNHEYTDVSFEIDGLRVASAHKSVLASRSPFFAGMFRSKTVEALTGVVSVEGVTAPSLLAFIEMVYLGTVVFEAWMCDFPFVLLL